MLINRVYGSISEKLCNKFFIIDKGDSVLKKYDYVFLELNIILKKLMIMKLISMVTMRKLNF